MMPPIQDSRVFSSTGMGPLSISFEFFPPKSDAMAEQMWRAMQRLRPLGPAFVSVTYGAGGSTRQRTHDTVVRLQAEGGLPCAAHLTCVGANRAEIDTIAQDYWDAGIRHLVALRGDAPDGQEYQPHPNGYANAAELVAGLRGVADFEISVAAYPELHPNSPSSQADLDNLKRKIDAGATRAITQFFFDADIYLRFLERARAAGIWVPIVPGILPVSNFVQAAQFAKACGATMPTWMAHLFEGLEDDAETRRMVAVTTASEQCRKLQTAGVMDFHFFTLNRAELTYAICHILGLRPKSDLVVDIVGETAA
ncbi:MAG: methylenetetrahydrofolate reductase [NAD(P)H] [Alphaproteobacteria bacterium]|jgi:methylenetetrahydrofolate reductase (NADPH)|nr:methylenetetrahydrofolate reductase [NAD(P)H] [Alphaproteobacteria bacterium]MDP6829753.1 methylenetetrahydrofolate reductase [NAD(P)H] [Alphaproteobacteria bacterium]